MQYYKYVTENNLEDKQNYMYSEFGGRDFLNAYETSRRDYIFTADSEEGEAFHDTRADLGVLKDRLESGEFESSRELLDAYVKRFEVSKRLYSEYNEAWKVAEKTSYDQLDIYILLSECCLAAYALSGCTKYLSCSLKVDDTLLSVADRLTKSERRRFVEVLKSELQEYKALASRLEVEA